MRPRKNQGLPCILFSLWMIFGFAKAWASSDRRQPLARSPLFRNPDRIRNRFPNNNHYDNHPRLSRKRSFSSTVSSSSGSVTALRGGGSGVVVDAFLRFAEFVGENRTRCLIMLFLATCFESYATTLSKRAKDTGNVLIFVRAMLVYMLCMVGFNLSLAKLDVSVAYAMWGAMGTMLVTAAGILFFGETLDFTKIVCLIMITAGVFGLNMR